MSSPDYVTSNATERGVGASPLRLRLRRETAELHQNLDARLALLTPDLSIHRYRRVLQIFYGFYAPVEARLLRVADVAPSLGLPLRARAKLLGDDLLTLGMSRRDIAALPLCTDLPRLVCPEELAGCLYVLEGACLGGQAIAPVLQRRLAVAAGSGASFFVGDGAATSARWARVVVWLDDLVGAQARSEDIVASACATFLTLTRWVEQQQLRKERHGRPDRL